jgi:hypothetical protein
VTAAPKTAARSKIVTHPVRPRAVKVDIVEASKAIAKRFPKVLAELAK